MRKIIATPIVASLLGMAALAAPVAAHAASDPANTTTTFAVTGGALTITAPGTNHLLGAYTLGSGAPDLSTKLGTVQVTDLRADETTPFWTASVSSSSFKTGAGTDAETIPATAVSYDPGTVQSQVNEATTYSPGDPGTLGGQTALTAMSTTDEVGVGGASWDPTISVHLPAQVVAGSYSGTITHSVA